MRKWMFATAALAAFALIGADLAAAQGQGAGMGRGQGQRMSGQGMAPGRGQMIQERIGMIDADGDGLIGRDELSAWRETVFYAMDVDGDDALTREEYMAVQFGRGADPDSRGPRYDQMQAAKAAEFEAMDADGDGVVAREPFIAYADRRFDAADANADGALTAPEFRTLHQGM